MEIGAMNKEEMQREMRGMMQQMVGDMSPEQKKEMILGIAAKLKEGVDMEAMMPKMLASMMAGGKGPGAMQEMMGRMKHGDDEASMPEMMLQNMMPHCIEMMMPAIAKEKRAGLASGLVSTVVEQASRDMSSEETAAFRAKLVAAIGA